MSLELQRLAICCLIVVLLGWGIYAWGAAFVFGVIFGAAVCFLFCCFALGGLQRLLTEVRT